MDSNFVLEPGTRGTAAADVFRLEKGRIAEHWDVLQQVPDGTADGHDMFSTVSGPRLPGPDPRASAATTERVGLALFKGLTVDHDPRAYDWYVAATSYEHTPGIANGRTAVKKYLADLFADSPDLSAGVKRVVVEGDYVAIHSHYKATPDDRGTARFDLLRVRNGKVVEHWDVVQPVPETSVNENTMF
ncbi:ester cyclase [Streptomyces sp. NPDC002588]|uniref:nuclear transport factor 2 family protein n=1 Tax=Streptomyces sp. NPDC002588 TaxID=3154419 RepID=UPI003317EBFE